MKKILLGLFILGTAVTVTSCGDISSEERLVTYLARTICLAEDAYKAIDATKSNASPEGVQELVTKTDAIASEIDSLKSESFGSTQQLEEVKEQVSDKQAVADRAIALAKTMCEPSTTSIQQTVGDYQ